MPYVMLLILLLLIGCSQVLPAVGGDATRWELTFADEGDGEAGSAPDPAKWQHDLGGHGWGNKEPQTYTPGNANAFYDGKGSLVIEARRENHTGADGIAAEFTSARIKTQDLFAQRYGKFEARIKLPRGQGIWPAFWMLGETFPTVGWPACGEIDIMEYLGHELDTVHGTIHGPGYSGGNGLQGSIRLTDGQAYADNFHVFTVEWEPKAIRWYVDGELFHTRTPEDVGSNAWAYDVPHFLILNVACGGEWPGYTDETTQFPQRMLIDYVRVYRDTTLEVDEAALAAYHQQRRAKAAAAEAARLEAATRPAPIPGTLLAAHFRAGGDGVAYRDADPENQGNAFRVHEGVDLGVSTDDGVDYSVGWTAVGEWLTYDVDVAEAGRYSVEARVASLGPGGVIRLGQQGQAIGSPGRVPNTGGWQAWQTVPMGVVQLDKGKQVLRLTMAEAGEGGTVGNVSKLIFTPVE